MPTDVTAQRLEIVTSPAVGTEVSAQLVEVVVAPDVPATRVTGMILEVVVAPDLPSGAGGAGGDCPPVRAGTRLWWALDVDIAGTTHVGTRAGEVDDTVYTAGLSDLALGRTFDPRFTVSVSIATGADWPALFRATGGDPEGGRARLFLVVEEGGVTRRILWSDGRVAQATWGRKPAPLALSIVASGSIGSIPPETWRVDDTTRPVQTADDPGVDVLTYGGVWELYDESVGTYYPLVLGYPGHVEGGAPYPCVPAPVVQWADWIPSGTVPEAVPEAWLHVIAGGDIEAEAVYLHDLGIYKIAVVEPPGGGTEERVEVPQVSPLPFSTIDAGQDLLGQRCTYFTALHNHDTQGGTPEMWVGYTRTAGYGGGLRHAGKLVRGASDIFRWLVESFTTLRLDLGRHAAHAPRLNVYSFDTWLNEPVGALEWFTSQVLEYVPAAIVRGEDGLYLAHIPTRATDVDVQLALRAGVNCTFDGMTSSTADGVVNALSYRWGPTRDGGFVKNYTLTDQYRKPVPLGTGTFYGDPRVLPHALAGRSIRLFGHRAGELELPTVWDDSTAHRIAEDFLLRRAFPERTLRYSVPPDLWHVEPGTVVSLVDDEMAIAGRYVVVGVTVRTTGADLELRELRELGRMG